MPVVTVAKGGSLYTRWPLYKPVLSGSPTELVDPDEFPEGPRFVLKQSGVDVEGFENLPYTKRLGRGVFSLNMPIPLGDALPTGDYTLHLALATKAAAALVDVTGVPPTASFTVVDGAVVYHEDRFYADAQELHDRYGVSPLPEIHEVRHAQQLLNDWMHRALWPTLVERERHEIPADRNLIMLDVRPVIRLIGADAGQPVDAAGMLGRYGYGRRDRRLLNQTSRDYLSALAVFGSPPRFVPIDVSNVDFHQDTGQVWLPTGFFLINYSQVEVTYEAGYRVIPEAAKLALAETILFTRIKGFGPLTNYSIGRVSQSTGDSLLTPEVKRRLEPYRLKWYR